MSEYIKHDYTTNIDVFSSKIIEDYQFKPAGTLIKKYALKDEFKVKGKLNIYLTEIINSILIINSNLVGIRTYE